MKKKTEKAYFNEQWDEMTTHLKAFIKSGEQEELHLFRVQVKKLRAMLVLLAMGSPKRKLLKDFKPVRQIFKHCGIIRNAFINLQLGGQYHINNEEFLLGQLYEIEKGTNEFKKSGRKYLKELKASRGTIQGDLPAIGNSQVTEFYKVQLAQIADVLNQLQFDEGLHSCRKQIKTLIYNRKIAQKALQGKLHVDNEYLDKLQDRIGNWHDNILAIELFSTPGVVDKPVITNIKRQNTRLKRSIRDLTRDFGKKAVVADVVLA